MGKKLQELRKSNSPLANDPKVLEVDQDINRFAAVAAFNTSEGGVELRKAMRSDIVGCINELTRSYGKADIAEMLAIAAKLDAHISLLQAMGNADQNKKDAEAMLDELTS